MPEGSFIELLPRLHKEQYPGPDTQGPGPVRAGGVGRVQPALVEYVALTRGTSRRFQSAVNSERPSQLSDRRFTKLEYAHAQKCR
jgi:hypothetical protein